MKRLPGFLAVGVLICAWTGRAQDINEVFSGTPYVKTVELGNERTVYDLPYGGTSRDRLRIIEFHGKYVWISNGSDEMEKSMEGGITIYRTKDGTGTVRVGSPGSPIQGKDAKGRPALFDYSQEEVIGTRRTTILGKQTYPKPSPAAPTQAVSEVKIGKQVWMIRNLDLGRFANGDAIPKAVTQKEWNKYREEGKPAWCHYEFNDANGEKYGGLYNWFAVSDPRGLAPKGWRIPTKEEFQIVSDYPHPTSGKRLKSDNDWELYEQLDEDYARTGKVSGPGDNSKGFDARPAGYAGSGFSGLHKDAVFWSATSKDAETAYYLSLMHVGDAALVLWRDKDFGMSVRCIKD